MKRIKKTHQRIFKFSLAASLFVSLSVAAYFQYRASMGPNRVEAAGNLTITYNAVPLSGPIFTVVNMLPGDCEQRSVTVANSASQVTQIAVRSLNENNPNNMASVLDWRVSTGATDLYGGSHVNGTKTLQDFFTLSQVPDSVALGNVSANSSVDYVFTACFDQNAGNQYQNAFVQFDLVFGEIIEITPTPIATPSPTITQGPTPTPTSPPIALPAECKMLEGIITKVVYGTSGDDDIRGTMASELFIMYEGDDEVDGGGGHDCIIGGPGNDELDGGTGNDVLVGGEGVNELDGGDNDDLLYGGNEGDELRGGAGDDTIYAGSGNDEVDGGSGNDTIYAGEGDDEIDAGAGNDLVYAGPGNDTIKGGSGNDTIWGGSGNDNIKGGSGNDWINGEAGFDNLNGDSGTDTCLEGEVVSACEL
jgi:Ca2+-binding RTX toxin-like protein